MPMVRRLKVSSAIAEPANSSSNGIIHDQWLETAALELRDMVHRIETIQRFYVTMRVLRLLVAMPSHLETLRTTLTTSSIKSVCLSLDESSICRGDLDPSPSLEDLQACAAEIGLMLAALTTPTELSILKAPAALVPIFVNAVSRSVTNLFLELPESMSANQHREIGQSLQRLDMLTNIYVSQVTTKSFCSIFSGMSACGSKLVDLHISGHRREHCTMASDEAARVLGQILSLPRLKKLRLERVKIVGGEAAEAFSSGILSSSVRTLVLNHVGFAESHHVQVGVALASTTNLVKLHYQSVASRELFDGFCATLTSATTTTACMLEEIQFALVTAGSLGGVSFGPLTLHGRDQQRINLEGCPDQKVFQQMQRVLSLNVQRRTSVQVFAAVHSSSDESKQRALLADALAGMDYSIVYEFLQDNKCNLIAYMQQLGRT